MYHEICCGTNHTIREIVIIRTFLQGNVWLIPVCPENAHKTGSEIYCIVTQLP